MVNKVTNLVSLFYYAALTEVGTTLGKKKRKTNYFQVANHCSDIESAQPSLYFSVVLL